MPDDETPVTAPSHATLMVTSQLLQELLKVIHDDGGEHTESLGLAQSVYDARNIVLELRMALRKAQGDLAAFQRKFGWSV